MTIAADLRHSGRRLVPLAFVALFPLVLSACGSPPMSSFDGEKSRVRGALSQSIACTEQGGGTKMLECLSPGQALSVRLVDDGAGLELWATWQANATNEADATYDELKKLANTYGLDQADWDRCVNERRYSEQSEAYNVLCQSATQGMFISVERVNRV